MVSSRPMNPAESFHAFKGAEGNFTVSARGTGDGRTDSRGVRAVRFLPTPPGLFPNHDEFDPPITDVISA